MEKAKLIDQRKRQGFSQEQMAELLCIDTSSYNRREKGKTKITRQEWKKLAGFLDVPLKEIYEAEDSFIINCHDQATGFVNGDNHVYNIPKSVLDSLEKYIHLLEEENKRLKKEL